MALKYLGNAKGTNAPLHPHYQAAVQAMPSGATTNARGDALVASVLVIGLTLPLIRLSLAGKCVGEGHNKGCTQLEVARPSMPCGLSWNNQKAPEECSGAYGHVTYV